MQTDAARNFMAPERHEDESLEVYRLRLAQQAKHAKAVTRGVLAIPPSKRTVEHRQAQRQVTKTLGARQARKLQREMRVTAKQTREAIKPPLGSQ